MTEQNISMRNGKKDREKKLKLLSRRDQLIQWTHGSTVGAWNVGANLLHGLVEVVLPHGVALSRQLRTGPAVHVVRVVAVVAAAVALAFPIILDVL